MRTESRAADHDRGRVEQLHFVGFTTDNEALMLSRRDDATSGEYFVAIDDYLLAAIEQFDGEGDDVEDPREETRPPSIALPSRSLPAPARMYPKPSSDLSPREIQSRLRSGSSISDVADEAGVEEEWIIRFAAPIIAEQGRVVEQAQRLTFNKPRVGPSSQPLRTSVRWNLAEQGALRDDEVFDAGWSAFNLQGARWVVRLSFVAKRRRKMAEWEVDLREGQLFARNRVATDLGYVEPGRRPKRGDSELAPPAPPARAKRAGVKKATRSTKAKKKQKAAPTKALKKRSALHRSARGPLAKKAPRPKSPVAKVVKGAIPRKATAGKVAAKKATAGKVAAKKVAPRKATAKKATARKGSTRKAPSEGPPAPAHAFERSSHLARSPSPIANTNRVVDRPAATSADQLPSPVSPPAVLAPAPDARPSPERAAEPVSVARVPVPEAGPVPEADPVPRRPPLVIMSTPDVPSGVPLSEHDLADEGSRWPLPRRRR
jgi:hypothetical protein